MLCKSPRLKINDRIVLGRKINELKSKNGLNLLGQNVWIALKWKEGFLGEFYHKRHGKNKNGSKPKNRPKPKRFLF